MRLIDRRLGLIFCGFLLLFSVALARAAWLQGVRGGELRADARTQQVTTVDVPGERGKVIDRNGKVLAVSEDAATIVATPYQVKDPATAAEQLAKVLPVSRSEIERELSDRKSGFAYIAKKVSLEDADAVEKLKIEGISSIPDSRRLYPQGALASQVIGAVSADNKGLTGLEQSEDSVLAGADGEQEVVHDARGEPIRFETKSQSSIGGDIHLTIDAAIQAKAEEAIAAAGERYAAKGATAVVMNPDTGDVLAMANWPGYDPTQLDQATDDELLNRATGFTYEPGSTFKAFTVSAALSEHLVTPSTSFHLPSTIKVADRTIEESHARPPIDATVAQILAQSSNVGAVTIGLKVGADKFAEWIKRFGFGAPTGVGFPGEEQGIVPARGDYSGSTMGNLPIGQGLSVTPMQMATAYSAIANGGIRRRPRLITRVGAEPEPPDAEGTRVISAPDASKVRTMLEGVLAPGGTASEVSVPGYQLAGKTGTAEKAANGGYSESKYVASFVGFAPARDPKLLVAVVVDEPTYVHTGGEVAAPVFGQIAEFALPYLGISPG
jgi:cell division protein FtsI (penicillin-binding protein 3)